MAQTEKQKAAAKKNLAKGKATQFKAGAQQVDIARAGGIASQAAQARKKEASALCYQMLHAKLQGKVKDKISEQYGLEDDDLEILSAMCAGQIRAGMNGDSKAFNAVIELAEKQEAKQKQVDRYDLPAKVIGKAFSDINRQIVPNKTYIFRGGRGGLKSSFISLKIIELIKNNPNMHACVVRKVAATIKDSVFAQIKWAIHELGLDDEFKAKNSPFEIEYRKTGQVIYFRGCDDPMKLKGIKPVFGYVGILWKEEIDQLDGEEAERNINQSVLRGGAESYDFASYNPPKSNSAWVNRKLLVPDDNRIVHTSCYTDAPVEWLGQKFIEDAEHLKEVNPAAYEHEYLGISNGEGGNVFEFVEVRTITDDELRTFDHIHQGVDWGWYPDQYAFLRTHYDAARERIYLMDELYVNKTPNAETGQWIIDKGYNDYPITCDSAEPKSVNDYRDMGIPARGAIKGAGSVEYGFKWLQCRTIVIDPERTPNAYQEIINYEYERDKEGNVISGYPDGNDHAISALRYAYEQLFNKRGTSA